MWRNCYETCTAIGDPIQQSPEFDDSGSIIYSILYYIIHLFIIYNLSFIVLKILQFTLDGKTFVKSTKFNKDYKSSEVYYSRPLVANNFKNIRKIVRKELSLVIESCTRGK